MEKSYINFLLDRKQLEENITKLLHSFEEQYSLGLIKNINILRYLNNSITDVIVKLEI